MMKKININDNSVKTLSSMLGKNVNQLKFPTIKMMKSRFNHRINLSPKINNKAYNTSNNNINSHIKINNCSDVNDNSIEKEEYVFTPSKIRNKLNSKIYSRYSSIKNTTQNTTNSQSSLINRYSSLNLNNLNPNSFQKESSKNNKSSQSNTKIFTLEEKKKQPKNVSINKKHDNKNRDNQTKKKQNKELNNIIIYVGRNNNSQNVISNSIDSCKNLKHSLCDLGKNKIISLKYDMDDKPIYKKKRLKSINNCSNNSHYRYKTNNNLNISKEKYKFSNLYMTEYKEERKKTVDNITKIELFRKFKLSPEYLKYEKLKMNSYKLMEKYNKLINGFYNVNNK